MRHDPWLVALSLLVAVQGAQVGLNLAVQIPTANGARRRALLAGAAVTLGIGIWAMHFVGMMAARLPGEIDYLVLPTLISFLVCVIVVALSLLAASVAPAPWGVALAAVFMGLGIVSMHYIGMAALSASLAMQHDPVYVIGSGMIAVVASSLALWLSFGVGPKPSPVVASVVLGLAISGMHYTAMAGLTVHPLDIGPHPAAMISSSLLAIVVAVVAFLVSGVFLLTLMPDRPGMPAARNVDAVPLPAGSGAPSETLTAALPLASADAATAHRDRLPIHRAGVATSIAAEQVAWIQANGHYTTVFDGSHELFCPLSISDVEVLLDPARFVRTHRSHLVNIDKIRRLRRLGDGAVAELDGTVEREVPISRNKVATIKASLDARREAQAGGRRRG